MSLALPANRLETVSCAYAPTPSVYQRSTIPSNTAGRARDKRQTAQQDSPSTEKAKTKKCTRRNPLRPTTTTPSRGYQVLCSKPLGAVFEALGSCKSAFVVKLSRKGPGKVYNVSCVACY